MFMLPCSLDTKVQINTSSKIESWRLFRPHGTAFNEAWDPSVCGILCNHTGCMHMKHASFTGTEAWDRGMPREAGMVLPWGSLDCEGSICEVVATKVGRVRLPSLPFVQESFPIQVCEDKGQRPQLSAGYLVRWDLRKVTYSFCASVFSFIRNIK